FRQAASGKKGTFFFFARLVSHYLKRARQRRMAPLEVSMLWLWMGFIAFVLVLLALDLGVFHRKAHVVGLKEALVWSGVWLGVALVFNVFIYFGYEFHWLDMSLADTEPDGRAAAVMFFTGYIVEKSLSVDNVFVMAVILSYFG